MANTGLRVKNIGLRATDAAFWATDAALQATDGSLRVSDVALRVTDVVLRVTNTALRVANMGLQVANMGLRVTFMPLRVTDAALWVANTALTVTAKPKLLLILAMTSTIIRADGALRALLRPDAPAMALPKLAILVALSGAVQGAMMGSYALFNGGSAVFMMWAAFKVPLFLGVAAALCLPALRVLYDLVGLGDEFGATMRAFAASQAAFAAILASLAPFVLVFYASGVSYRGALLLNLALFAIAGVAAQGVARGRLQKLLARDGRHLKLWALGFVIWAFVAVQLAWNLRPFLGAPDSPLEFLRPDAFSNVYLGLWRILFG